MTDTDRAALIEQYADAENLTARIRLHETYETADRDWWRWVFDQYESIPATATVLEVGCGTGRLWQDNADRIPADWRLLLTDRSAGMVAETRTALTTAGVDAAVGIAPAERLPLSDDTVDAVIANHMLYHTDRDRSLPELRRVLRPAGRLFATTNGETNLHELRTLLAETTAYDPRETVDFTLDGGARQLADHFDTVYRHDRESMLRVPDLEPLVAYAASLPGVDRAQVTAFAAAAEAELADGPLEIRKEMGMLVAETAGDDEEREAEATPGQG